MHDHHLHPQSTGAVPPVAVVPVAPTNYVGAQGQTFASKATAGAPNTVTMPVTSNVLSLPDPVNEGLLGYVLRVAVQCGCDETKAIGINNSVLEAQDGIYDSNGKLHSDWPTVADAFYNHDSYSPMSPDITAKMGTPAPGIIAATPAPAAAAPLPEITKEDEINAAIDAMGVGGYAWRAANLPLFNRIQQGFNPAYDIAQQLHNGVSQDTVWAEMHNPDGTIQPGFDGYTAADVATIATRLAGG